MARLRPVDAVHRQPWSSSSCQEWKILPTHSVWFGRSAVDANSECVHQQIHGSKKISKMHAVVWMDDDGSLYLKDHSANGTFCNGNKIGHGNFRQLAHGDLIAFVLNATTRLEVPCYLAELDTAPSQIGHGGGLDRDRAQSGTVELPVTAQPMASSGVGAPSAPGDGVRSSAFDYALHTRVEVLCERRSARPPRPGVVTGHRSQLSDSGKAVEQAQVKYDGGGSTWVAAPLLRALAEDVAEADVFCSLGEWQQLPHGCKCAYSLSALTDPAQGASCTHLAMVNYDALLEHARMSGVRRAVCPVVGCQQVVSQHCIVRCDALRASLGLLRATTVGELTKVWVRGSLAELSLTDPTLHAATGHATGRMSTDVVDVAARAHDVGGQSCEGGEEGSVSRRCVSRQRAPPPVVARRKTRVPTATDSSSAAGGRWATTAADVSSAASGGGLAGGGLAGGSLA